MSETLSRKLLSLVRRTLGTAQISSRLDVVERKLERLGFSPNAATDVGPSLQVLPGCEYARFALPIDYTPSRAYGPRYGVTRPPVPSLARWFEEHLNDYAARLEVMSRLRLDHIPKRFEERGYPSPSWLGGAIAPFDSLALYAMVSTLKPTRFVEIGSGMTTCFARQAVTDFKLGTRITSIDPEPRGEIDAICDTVIRDGLETCDLNVFDTLEAGDILFLDGSHRSFMNSDVTVFFIDVLPRLSPGVVVHIHDITLPWDYAEMFRDWYWNEQYLLAVYMMQAMDRIIPLFPTAFVCRNPAFADWFTRPPVDLGSANDGWRGGGSMWFTHRTNPIREASR